MSDSLHHSDMDAEALLARQHDELERLRAENARLLEENSRAGFLYDTMSEGVAIHDIVYDTRRQPSDYIIRDVNPAYEQLMKKPREAVVGRSAMEVYGTGEPPYLKIFAEVAETGEAASFAAFFKPLEKHFQITVVSQRRGTFMTVLSDITEHHMTAEALRLSEAQYETILNALPDLIFELGDDGAFLYARAPAAMGYFRPEEQFLGRRVEEVMPPEVARLTMYYMRRALDLKETQTYSYQLPTLSGPRDYESRLAPLGSQRALAIVRDVTDQNRAQAQARRQLEYLNALRTIDLAITASLDLRVTLHVIMDQFIAQPRVDGVALYQYSEHARELRFAMGRGFRGSAPPPAGVRLGEPLAGAAAMERRVVSIPDLRKAVIAGPIHEFVAGEGFVAYTAIPLMAKAQLRGVVEIFERQSRASDPDWMDFMESLASQAAIAIDNAAMFESLQRGKMDLELAYDQTLEGWARALDLKDRQTEGHTRRVAEMTVQLARLMGVPEEEMSQIYRGAMLHDIGKVATPDAILSKEGPLTDEEWAVMRRHPELAFEWLSGIHYMRAALDIPWCHHERWDGTGYPRGLKGEQIPLAARLFAVVDTWDALSQDRPYRPAWSRDKALAHLREGAGRQFDPAAVKAFLQMIGA